MAFHTWCLLASVFLASVGAEVYDQGPQTFFESSSPSPQSEQFASRELVLYLTPSQAKALETSGALVRPQFNTENEREETEEPQVVEEQREPQYEDNTSEEEQKEDSDSELEEIFKILNQQKVNEELEKREEEQAAEKQRETPARFKVTPKIQQEEKKYFSPSVAKKFGAAKSYSYVRFLHPSEEPENLKLKPYNAQQSSYYFLKNQDSGEQEEKQSPEETPAPESQEDKIASLLQHRKVAARIFEHRDRLLKNELELQTKLRDLQDAPKYNDQKYAIEIEKLRSNLEKQNALFKAEALAKAAPVVIKEEISVKQRRPVEVVKRVKVPVPSPVIVRVPQPFEVKVPQTYTLPVGVVRPVPAPLVKTEKIEAQKPAPVETERRAPGTVTKNVYVKVNKPYLVERLLPVEVNRESPEEVTIRKPEKLTIVRHIWEH